MQPHLEEAFRNVAANSMAQGFIVEVLLMQYLKMFSNENIPKVVETLLETSRRTAHFAGRTQGNEALSELFADVVIRMHGEVEGLVERALERLAAGRRASGGEGL